MKITTNERNRFSFLLVMLFLASVWTISAEFQVVSFGDTFTEIEFNLPDYEMESVEYDGVTYQRLYHPLYGLIMEEGLPEVLSFSFLLSIPPKGIVQAEELKITETEVIKGIKLFPSQGFNLEIDEDRGFLIDKDFYEKDIEYPNKPIQISSPAIMRGMRLVSVNINPISYNPAREELTLAKNVTIRINYNYNVQGENEIEGGEKKLSRTFERIQRGSVVNYDQFRNPGTRNEYQARSILVVHHHTTEAQYVNSLTQFLNWKRDKGFEVATVSTAECPTNTSIKNYIQNAYNNWENPPEYVVLIGDVTSNIAVPRWVEYQNAYIARNVNGDHPYSLMEGNDLLSDVVVGRIAIGSGFQLATIWNKIKNYEKIPYMIATNWYNHQLLVGDRTEGANNSGVSAYYTSLYVKNVMDRYNSNFNYTEIYTPPFPTPMQNGINQGAAYFSFRGMYGLAGWNPGEAQFTNGYMLPNVCALTCRSMDYEGVWGFSLGHQFRMGTPTSARGFITALGISASSDTAFNNLLTAAVFGGLFVQDMWTMGEAMVYAKYEHYRAFWNSHQWRAEHYFQMLNMKGDPTMDVWKGVPKTLNVEYPQELPFGSNSIQITVTDGNDEPLKDAWVTIRKGETIGGEAVFATGYTNENGKITHFFANDQVGEVTVTVTKPQYKPHLGNFEITQSGGVAYHELLTNDDIVAGETVNFVIRAKNYSNQQANQVSGVISTDSEYIEIVRAQSPFGNIASNAVGNSTESFIINISPQTPENHRADFLLTLTDNNQNNWISRFNLVIGNGKLKVANLVIEDGNNGVLDPREEARLMFRLENIGGIDLNNVYAVLSGGGFGLEVVSDTAFYGNVGVGEAKVSRDRHFAVSTSAFVIPGMSFDLTITAFNEEGFQQKIPVKVNVGTVRRSDPLGPCPYGYWIYDSNDTDYLEAPEYEWIEIVPTLGGMGINTGLTANYNDIQRTVTRDLPFTFRMYGEEYDTVSICANGWITFVPTDMATQRNWRLPGPLGPDPIVAAFWDNLGLTQGGVYTYFDEEQHIFIIQWQNATNVQLNAVETFQIILYDPEQYFTSTNDGAIKIQYKTFNNVNNRGGTPGGPQPQFGEWGNYCTIGISDHTGLRGLEYTFNNEYPTAAMPLGNETAIYITTGSLAFTPYVVIDEISYVDDNDNVPMFGETGSFSVRMINLGGIDSFGINAVLSSTDEYVEILQNRQEFGDIASQELSVRNNAFQIRIADDIPDGHKINFNLNAIASDNTSWNSRFNIDVAAPSIIAMTPFIHDPLPGGNNNGLVEPGESLIVYLPIKNFGGADSPEVNLTVTSDDPLVTIEDISETSFPIIYSSEIQYPAVAIEVSEETEVGMGLVFNYRVETGEYVFEGNFLLGLGGIIPAQLGSGDATTSVSMPAPINIYFRSLRSQTVYTAEEIKNAGITSGGPITEFGFWVAGAPDYSLTNFKIRMRHTDAIDARDHIREPYQTVYSNAGYRPLAGGWDMLELDPPFVWNGEDNILVDTAFAPVEGWGNSGQVRYYEVADGYRYTRQDTPDQTNVETTTTTAEKPQARMMVDTSAGDTSNRPESLTASQVGTAINLNWTPPLEQQALRGYNVYRNGISINDGYVQEAEYIDSGYNPNTICYYYVTAVYEHRETLPSNIVAVNFNATESPQIAPEPGSYFEPINITMTTTEDEVTIFYTLDGSEPTEESNVYEEPFEIVYHTLVKARAFREGTYPSLSASSQYYILYPPRELRTSGTMERLELKWNEPWAPEDEEMLVDNTASVTRNSTLIREEKGDNFESKRAVQPQTRKALLDRASSHSYRTEIEGYNVYRSTNGADYIQLNNEPLTSRRYVDTSLELKDYHYYVTTVYGAGESRASNIVNVGPTSIDEEEMPTPLITKLHKAYPNPFNPETVISFSLSCKNRVCIEIFDITGRRVKILADEIFESGNHSILWKGDDNSGKKLGSGVYLYRMKTAQYSVTRKAMLLK